MSITLRAEKQQPLSFDEIDINFASFYYSSSLFEDQQGNNFLRLHYTGSTLIGNSEEYLPGYDQYPLGGSGGGDIVNQAAGKVNTIQFNDGTGGFDSSDFFVKTKTGVGINISNPTRPVHIMSTSTADSVLKIDCKSTLNNTSNQKAKAYLEVAQGGVNLSRIGKLYETSNDIFFNTEQISGTDPTIPGIRFNNKSTTDSSIASALTIRGNRIGIKQNIPNKDLSIVGEVGIGKTSNINAQQSIFGSTLDYGLNSILPSNTSNGFAILPPLNGGHTTIGILNNLQNQDANNSFTVASSVNSRDFSKGKAVFKVTANGVTSINDILHINPIKTLPRSGRDGMIVVIENTSGTGITPYIYSAGKWVDIFTGTPIG